MSSKRKQAKLKREREERDSFQRELLSLLRKHNVTLVAESSGGAYCSSSVSLRAEREGDVFMEWEVSEDLTEARINDSQTTK